METLIYKDLYYISGVKKIRKVNAKAFNIKKLIKWIDESESVKEFRVTAKNLKIKGYYKMKKANLLYFIKCYSTKAMNIPLFTHEYSKLSEMKVHDIKKWQKETVLEVIWWSVPKMA